MKNYILLFVVMFLCINVHAKNEFINIDCSTIITSDIRILNYCAEKGDAFSQYNLAVFYRDGITVNKDYDKAFFWFSKSAEKGFVESIANLGWFYENGVVVKQDYEKAFALADESARKGSAIGLNNLGVYYQKGLGCDIDFIKGFSYLKQAVNLGDNSVARINLSYTYFVGLGVERSVDKAISLIKDLAKQGNIIAMTNLGIFYRSLGEYEKSFYWLIKSSELNYPLAQAQLGFNYAYGIGIEANSEQAMYWLNLAMDKNESQAFFLLGAVFSEGTQVFEKDDSKAFYFYQKAALMGNNNAQNNLANWYLNGRYVKKEVVKAEELYLQAAEKGLPESINMLVKIYKGDFGIKYKNKEKYEYWFKKLKESGFKS